MGLVSGLYQLAPSQAHTREERIARNRHAIRRLLGTHGADVVLTRLLEAPADEARTTLLRLAEIESARNWLRSP